uniref:Floral defensin-like protein 1 n=1 Tax=Petunia hybrida TaxID=4102 RepID=DEF1_PETHY|nr:RecName: Full=Floral defensin-like protein 1; AltName: Full=PhD1; Flags: Precursor [Petunia x hybrida]AAN64750.1 floral defensin-like protein 1 [Petunia x hybrida]
MARSICFFAVAILALMLFAAYDAEAATCKAECPTWDSVCINKKPCVACCKKAKFSDGHCSKILRRCLCTKECVFEKTEATQTETFTKDVNTLAEALLEADMMV